MRAKTAAALVSVFLLLGGCQTEEQLPEEPAQPGVMERASRVLWAASTALEPPEGSEGETGNGFAEVEFREDRSAAVKIRVNLFPPARGQYVGWLARSEPPRSLRLGILRRREGDGSYFLEFRRTVDPRDFQKVMVTRSDSQEENPVASDVMVEGMLTVVHSSG